MKFLFLSFVIVIVMDVRPAHSKLEFKYAQDSLRWDVGNLNTGKMVPYLTPLEKEVLIELNKVRSDPARYSRLYISPILKELKGKLNTRKHEETKEGAAAVYECIDVLEKTGKIGLLHPDKDLTQIALRHTSKQSKTRETGHDSPDGETFDYRFRKLKSTHIVGECISYGEKQARDIVTSLLVDDGVPSRGHRHIILEARLTMAGISVGGHLLYGNMCTIDFAGIVRPGK